MLGDGGDDDPLATFRGRSPSPERSPRGRSRSRDRGDRDGRDGRDGRDFRRRSRSRSRSPPRRRHRSRSWSRDRRRSRSRSRSRDRDRRDARDDRRRHERDDRRGDRRDDDRRRDDRFVDRRPSDAHHADDGNAWNRTDNPLPPPPPRAHHNPPPPRGGDPSPPAVTSVVRGVVTSVRPFGIFVRPAGKARDGLVHCTQVSDELTFTREDSDDAKVMAMEYFFPKGAEVWVKVLDVTVEGGNGNGGYADPSTLGAPPKPERRNAHPKTSLSMKLVDQETGEDLDPEHASCFGGRGKQVDSRVFDGDSSQPPILNSIVRAAVRAVKPYGVFVRPEGKQRDALVPSHQVSEHLRFDKEDDDAARVAGLEGVVSVGDFVFAKIVEIKHDAFDTEKPPRVTASMKLCDQTSGEDLDPEGTKYRPSGDRGDAGGAVRDARVGAGAGDRVRAGGVIDWGHHSADVKQMRMPGEDGRNSGAGNQYDLLEDDPEADREMRGARFDGHGPDGRAPPPPPPGGPPPGGGGVFEVPPPGGPPLVGSVEEALAILAKHKREKKARKAEKKARKKARKKEKKSSKSKRRQSRSSSSSSSEYSSSDDERARRRKCERR